MQLYFVRHGETEWNKEYRYYGKTDIPLNRKGEEQGRRVGILLKDISFDTIYTSPLKRARQTKQLIINENYTKEIEKFQSIHLSEQDLGIFEGYTYKELKAQFPEQLRQWNEDFRSAPHGGENFYDFYSRIYEFCEQEIGICGLQPLETLLYHKPGQRREKTYLEVIKGNQEKKVLIISHMGVFRCLFSILLGMGEDAIWNFTMEQGTYSRVDIEDGYTIIKKINQS